MGNADLRELAVITDITFDDVAGSLVAIDAHNWLYRYLTTTVRFTRTAVYTTDDGEEVANLIGIIQGLPKLLEHDVTPVFVFDGGVTELKADEIADREDARATYQAELEAARARDDADAAEIATLDSRTQTLTETIIDTTRDLFELLDIPTVDAPAEGEAQAAYMARNGPADYAGTEDYDALLLGSPYTLRQLTSKGDPECMDFAATLETHDLTWEHLVEAALLMGTDFNDGLPGVGPKTAVSLIHEHGDLEAVLATRDESIPHADRIRDLFLNPAVTDEYTLDTDIDPDLTGARAYVTETWEIPTEEVDRGFERIESAVTQTGLDRWT